MSRASITAAVASILVACSGSDPTTDASTPVPGGEPCLYDEISGTATILAIDSEPTACPDAVSVVFAFSPTDATARDRYRFPEVSDERQQWTGSMGATFSRTCLDALGVNVGSKLPARRSEITQGACTPSDFAVEVDAAACNHPCS